MAAEVLLSFAGPDRKSARAELLRPGDGRVRRRRLSVWLDESSPPPGGGIERHLSTARMMLVLYSAAYDSADDGVIVKLHRAPP